jgi:hypothetical protein
MVFSSETVCAVSAMRTSAIAASARINMPRILQQSVRRAHIEPDKLDDAHHDALAAIALQVPDAVLRGPIADLMQSDFPAGPVRYR